MLRVSDINWQDKKYVRAGIIPVVQMKGVTFYGFGVENGVGAIADFGGHREKSDKDALDTAIREYEEEALNVFGKLTRDQMQDYYVLDGVDTAEILVPVDPPFYRFTEKFYDMLGNNPSHEVQSIIWLSRNQLLTAIDSQQIGYKGVKIFHMYDRISNTIHVNRDRI